MNKHRLITITVLATLATVGSAYAQEPEPSPFPIPSNGTAPSSWSSEYWVGAPTDQAMYKTIRMATGLIWSAVKLLFTVADALAGFRAALVGMFSNVLDVLGAALLPIVQPLVILCVFAALVFLLVQPVFTLSLVSVRRGVALALAVPLVFAAMGAAYTTLETLRMDVAQSLGALVFDTAQAQQTSGGDIAPIVVYNADAPNRLADITAATLFVQRADVQAANTALPAAFEQRFYTPPPSDWSALSADVRQAYLAQASAGFDRMLYGSVPAVLLVLESAMQALMSFALGMLFLGFTLALAFAAFGPFASTAYTTGTMILHAVLGSWGISAVQGVIIAYLVQVAAGGNPTQIVAMAGFALFLHVAFVLVAALWALRAIFTTASAPMPGTPEMASAALRGAGAAGGINAGGAMSTMRGYAAARRFGASRTYAAGYALSPNDAVQSAARTGLIMGAVDPWGELNQGIYAGAVGARENIDSYRAIMRQANLQADADDQQNTGSTTNG